MFNIHQILLYIKIKIETTLEYIFGDDGRRHIPDYNAFTTKDI